MENSVAGTSVSDTNIKALDADDGNYGRITYYLESKDFSINITSGIVYVTNNRLDRESKSSYTMLVTAMDTGNFSSSTQLIISVLDANDNYPLFELSTQEVIISENKNNSAPVFVIKATDKDEEGSVNANLTYTLTSVPANISGHLVCNQNTGEIFVTKPFDYEELTLNGFDHGQFDLEITVSDQGEPSLNKTTSLNIKITDVNDHAPIFDQPKYKGNVPENSPKGTSVNVVLQSTDSDGTKPNNETFYLIASDGQGNFMIDRETGVITVGMGANLDREARDSYKLTVVVSDKGVPRLSSTTTVEIAITDVNDVPPEFREKREAVTVYENSTIGTRLHQLNATDQDIDHNLHFTIVWGKSQVYDEYRANVNVDIVKNWFDLEARGNTCNILVNATMDRELAEEVILLVQVEDLNAVNKDQTAEALITIHLEDVNDNNPQITNPEKTLKLKISEGVQIGQEVKELKASDKDKNQDVTFTLKGSQHFNISSDGQLFVKKHLDRETNPFLNFTVVVTDNGYPPLSSSFVSMVTVIDVNDNDPIFNLSKKNYEIPENSNISSIVGVMKASDLDEGPNSNVTYAIQDTNQLPFTIDPNTGVITVSGELDRETQDKYSLKVVASDNPIYDNKRRVTETLTINVTDINDNTPQFKKQNYEGSISESASENDPVRLSSVNVLSATDKDVGKNGRISFSIKALDNDTDFFKVDTRIGSVFVKVKSLKNLPGIYSYTVFASDNGHPAKETTANLSIEILDENIHTPNFISSGPIQPIPECTKTGYLLYTFQAIDEDKNKDTNGFVTYHLVKGGNYFTLDSKTGELRLKKLIDREKLSGGILSIEVAAEDKGVPATRKTTTGSLQVKIIDVNDSPTEFDLDMKRRFEVKENIIKAHIGSVKASDKDENANIVYSIEKGPWSDHFKIDSRKDLGGVISVIKPLDRETVDTLDLTIKATDQAQLENKASCGDFNFTSSQLSASVSVTVKINDVDDNPPTFRKRSLSQGFLSNTDFNTLLFKLEDYVEDNDTAANSAHHFYLSGDIKAHLSKTVDVVAYPVVIGLNGSVLTNFKFREDVYGDLSLQVLVNDTGGEDIVDLTLDVVGESQIVRYEFYQTEDNLRKIKTDIASVLQWLGLEFIPDNILPYENDDGTKDGTKSVLVMHAKDKHGKILQSSELLKILDSADSEPYLNKLKKKYKLLAVKEKYEQKTEPEDNDRLEYILIAVISCIVVAFLITLIMLIHNIRRFKRKLKAATLEVHGMDPVIDEKFPGLDSSTIKNANPVFDRHDIVLQATAPDSDDDEAKSHSSNDSIDDNVLTRADKLGKSENDMDLDLYGDEYDNVLDTYDIPVALKMFNSGASHTDYTSSESQPGQGEMDDKSRRKSSAYDVPKTLQYLNAAFKDESEKYDEEDRERLRRMNKTGDGGIERTEQGNKTHKFDTELDDLESTDI